MDEKTLGANIRSCRERSGATLTALAQRAGLTKSALSKIETGKGSPPISTLLRIAEALGAPLAEMFAEPEASIPYVLTRRGEGRVIIGDGSRFGYSYEALALDMPRKVFEPFLLTIRPGDPQGVFQHAGQEFIHMLSGELEFTIAGQKLRLRQGDSLYLDPSLEHRTRVVGKRPARFLCLFTQDSVSSKFTASTKRKK